MVIDFRTRPPYKSFVSQGNFFPRPMEEDFSGPEEISGIYWNSVGIQSAKEGDFSLYLKELDESGIDLQIVQGRKVREGMASVNNRDVCELEKLYPQRFLAFPAVDTADVPGAVAEIEFCAKNYGIRGIALEPGWSMPPKCEELGLICAFTLSVLAGEDLSYCNPIALQHTALRFPRVTFTVSHGCWPFVEEFLGVALQCMNVYCYPDFFCNLPDMPFADQFVRAANSYLRYRMMFATSYPVRPLAQSLKQFLSLPFEQEVLELLLHKNAERILGLS